MSWILGFRLIFSTILHLVLGREVKDPGKFPGLWFWVCPSLNVLITLNVEFHHISPHPWEGFKGTLQKQGLWVTTKRPALRNAWRVTDLSCGILSLQCNGRLPWAESQASQSVWGDSSAMPPGGPSFWATVQKTTSEPLADWYKSTICFNERFSQLDGKRHGLLLASSSVSCSSLLIGWRAPKSQKEHARLTSHLC